MIDTDTVEDRVGVNLGSSNAHIIFKDCITIGKFGNLFDCFRNLIDKA